MAILARYRRATAGQYKKALVTALATSIEQLVAASIEQLVAAITVEGRTAMACMLTLVIAVAFF